MLFDYINEKTGFAERDPFQSGSEVRAYFTLKNMAFMFGDDYELTQPELDEMAELVIQKKWHIREEKSKVFSVRVNRSDTDEDISQKITELKQKIYQFRT